VLLTFQELVSFWTPQESYLQGLADSEGTVLRGIARKSRVMLDKTGNFSACLPPSLFADGALGTPIFSRHPLRKVPFTMSSKAAFINGKQALAASLKSLSLVSSFFLVTYTHHVLQFNEIAIEGTLYTKASLAAAMAEEWNLQSSGMNQ